MLGKPQLPQSFIVVWLLPIFFPLLTNTASPVRGGEFELLDGDRVVFLGDGLIEQEQYFGWIEVMLTTAFPDHHVTFRNLGWSGDTPAGDSRFGLSLLQAGREPADEGWQQLQKQLELTQPTMLVLGYGMASALEGGEAGLPQFVADFQRLIATAERLAPGIRFLFLSPVGHTDLKSPQAKAIAAYSQAVKQLAREQRSPFVDIGITSAELHKDPIHLNDRGYQAAAVRIAEVLEIGELSWLHSPPAETLRQIVLQKNTWWFHRSRPANMAYVFGFRKHEQGQNAIEIPQFDKLIAEEERKIALLRGLGNVELPAGDVRLESKYAEFTEQPVPEFTIDDDWEVTLWAQNPQLNKPIHMNFDPQGRLWVASSEAYPMIEVGQSAPDKIVVLEDTDGDGRSDTSHVFAEGLLIPTGIAPGNGGVYVAQSTDLLFLKDTDGDGRADVKRRVLSGFGTEDTHHNLHTLRWGPDGRLYMNQSVYTRTDAETPFGVTRLKAGGGFRYDPRTMRMEVFFRGLWNSWGHQFDAFGQSFLTDGAGFAGVAYAFPGATFNPTPQARQQLDLISPGNWPKFASLEIVQGEAYPPDWQGSIVTCDFRANRVTRFSLTEQDAGFLTKQEPDLLRTSAPTFRPIDVKQGPDGALYIADWSNPIINHGEVDFRDPRRDRWHGRIWRVAWKGGKRLPKLDYSALETAELLEALNSQDQFVRDQARRVLVERPLAAADQLDAWVRVQTADTSRLEALWLHQALNKPNLPLLQSLLSAGDASIRAAATRVLSCWADPQAVPAPLLAAREGQELLRNCVADEHPRVRLEAVRGLGRLGTAEAGEIALACLNMPMDRFIEHALFLTVNELSVPLMEAIEKGQWQANSREAERQLEFLLTAIEPTQASRFLAQRLSAQAIPKDGSGPWIELIGKAGGPAELEQLFVQAIEAGWESPAQVRALESLASAQRIRKLRPSNGLRRIGQLINSSPEEVRIAAVALAGDWKLASQLPAILSLAASTANSEPLRDSAIDALRQIGGGPAVSALLNLAGNDPDVGIRRRALFALAGLDASQAVEPFLIDMAATESEQQALELWRGVLNSRGMGRLVAKALGRQPLPEWAIMAGLRAARDGGRNEPELLAALAPLSTAAVAAKLTPQRVEQLVKLVSAGNPARGEMIYRRQELACATCHAIGGVGGHVGPDMTSLGASAPVDYLIESLYDPNAKIKEGYHSVVVLTDDDQIVTGVEQESTAEELVLRDANNKLVRIPRSDVVAKKPGDSLMPVGVVDRLAPDEQADLIAFLSQLGKPGAYDASQGGVARVYEVFAGTHRIEQLGAERIIQGEVSEDWLSLNAFVSGGLPAEILKELTRQPINIALVHIYLRTKIEKTGAGEATFTVPGPAAMWIDGQPVEGQAEFTKQLSAGEHIILVRLDARDLPDVFKLESRDVLFDTGEVVQK